LDSIDPEPIATLFSPLVFALSDKAPIDVFEDPSVFDFKD
jgi:hypothetical protein